LPTRIEPPAPATSGEGAKLRPVETAPKDGSYFLFAGTQFDGGWAVVHWSADLEWWMLDDGKNFEIAMRAENGLTGWLPLPAALATPDAAPIACSCLAAVEAVDTYYLSNPGVRFAIRDEVKRSFVDAVKSATVSADLPADVRALVIAGREFWEAHNAATPESVAMDAALEAFSARVPYDDEPDAAPIGSDDADYSGYVDAGDAK